ncbi:MAG: (2Fe-2S)-binding protein [Planctomycetes bacterium]|nr:(2Fe-2S)-binding protein [Planctomycetota bacterium]
MSTSEPAVHFEHENQTCPANAGESILEVATREFVELPHNCGGIGACTTCHVVVLDGLEHLAAMEPIEEELLDQADRRSTCSRLACQARLTGTGPLRVVPVLEAADRHFE